MFRLKVIEGTPGYIPPEAIDANLYSNKSDIFALGVTLFQLLTKKSLWGTNFNLYPNCKSNAARDQLKSGTLNAELFAKNIECDNSIIPEYLLAYSQYNHDELTELVLGLLKKDPSQRFCPRAALNQAWLNKQGTSSSCAGHRKDRLLRHAIKKCLLNNDTVKECQLRGSNYWCENAIEGNSDGISPNRVHLSNQQLTINVSKAGINQLITPTSNSSANNFKVIQRNKSNSPSFAVAAMTMGMARQHPRSPIQQIISIRSKKAQKPQKIVDDASPSSNGDGRPSSQQKRTNVYQNQCTNYFSIIKKILLQDNIMEQLRPKPLVINRGTVHLRGSMNESLSISPGRGNFPGMGKGSIMSKIKNSLQFIQGSSTPSIVKKDVALKMFSGKQFLSNAAEKTENAQQQSAVFSKQNFNNLNIQSLKQLNPTLQQREDLAQPLSNAASGAQSSGFKPSQFIRLKQQQQAMSKSGAVSPNYRLNLGQSPQCKNPQLIASADANPIKGVQLGEEKVVDMPLAAIVNETVKNFMQVESRLLSEEAQQEQVQAGGEEIRLDQVLRKQSSYLNSVIDIPNEEMEGEDSEVRIKFVERITTQTNYHDTKSPLTGLSGESDCSNKSMSAKNHTVLWRTFI
ncbi:hypothetical protein FGO68_gene4804 [Halteria grandinella]|uniref:non-specific serine/threonine protein kinase n=1 Tax=Halteria grandinella TaxID=5974 RepID=A0A8J8P3J5_HALGN|nr:hypothetical protein FGO68_gene4804 [Halteria grandinella]